MEKSTNLLVEWTADNGKLEIWLDTESAWPLHIRD
jgi:hypothetical protein